MLLAGNNTGRSSYTALECCQWSGRTKKKIFGFWDWLTLSSTPTHTQINHGCRRRLCNDHWGGGWLFQDRRWRSRNGWGARANTRACQKETQDWQKVKESSSSSSSKGRQYWFSIRSPVYLCHWWWWIVRTEPCLGLYSCSWHAQRKTGACVV